MSLRTRYISESHWKRALVIALLLGAALVAVCLMFNIRYTEETPGWVLRLSSQASIKTNLLTQGRKAFSPEAQKEVLNALWSMIRETVDKGTDHESLTDAELWTRIIAEQPVHINCGRISRLMGQTLGYYGIENRRITLGSWYVKTNKDGQVEDGWNGHVGNEIWSPEYHKWFFVDFYNDCMFRNTKGEPQTVAEIQEQYVQYGADPDQWDIRMIGEFSSSHRRHRRRDYGTLFRVIGFQLNEDYMHYRKLFASPKKAVYRVMPKFSKMEYGVFKRWMNVSAYRQGRLVTNLHDLYSPPD